MQRISALGLDLGHRRIGVAGCDGTGLIATGLTTIRRTSFAKDIELLRQIVTERQVKTLVVGLPYTMNGDVGTQAQRTQKLAKRIAKALDLPLDFIDERLTSHEAESMMREQRINPAEQRGMIDRKAAALILQRWLDQKPWISST
ncbi:Holliday junction resolvase RuvX [Acaryochloris sp. 'Moss Beach']|uniref:Holliday junction resolvase RuvX n=1 Tax=Acaryochloris TaxID=155977 RepID=UPI001BB00416|nr:MULTISPECIES: Holliday junction resolvase RuvX [Acaryochloris]QUY40463.1 Holliday junction resolvase RuvX [Acaryochloris marina S15]UJB69693.1 Holliday junction resolvase RuvX [Acaryochloris sp. 'Moss Beach']